VRWVTTKSSELFNMPQTKFMPTAAADQMADRIAEVETRSAALVKELGVADLILIQVLYVVGSFWVGTAAKLGYGHIIFWLLAIALYYLPQAAVVIYLNRLMPLEGGLYQWATVGLGEFAGFLVAWNQWAYAILIIATFAVIIATNLSYVITPLGAAFTTVWWYTPSVTIVCIVGLTLVALRGLSVGKWVQNIGGIAQLLTFGTLIVVPFVAVWRGIVPSYHPLTAAFPAMTLLNLNLFGKMALGALSGFEYVAVLAGECRNARQSIGRSVVVSAPVIAVMFILGTSSVAGLIPSDHIDLVSPIPQTISAGLAGLQFAGLIVPALITLLLLRQIGSVMVLFAVNTRLPMVAGWDGILPGWFTRLHPRFGTPHNSIIFVGVLTLALSLAGQVGVGIQEAFQVLENSAGIFYAFTYLALFAIPVVAANRLAERASMGLRIAASLGFMVTLLYIVLSIFPIIDVVNWKVFTAKIVGVLIVGNLLGMAIYFLGRRPSHSVIDTPT
jgi:amino acid transporter